MAPDTLRRTPRRPSGRISSIILRGIPRSPNDRARIAVDLHGPIPPSSQPLPQRGGLVDAYFGETEGLDDPAPAGLLGAPVIRPVFWVLQNWLQHSLDNRPQPTSDGLSQMGQLGHRPDRPRRKFQVGVSILQQLLVLPDQRIPRLPENPHEVVHASGDEPCDHGKATNELVEEPEVLDILWTDLTEEFAISSSTVESASSNPNTLRPSRRATTSSRPKNAPPQMNRTFDVSKR